MKIRLAFFLLSAILIMTCFSYNSLYQNVSLFSQKQKVTISKTRDISMEEALEAKVYFENLINVPKLYDESENLDIFMNSFVKESFRVACDVEGNTFFLYVNGRVLFICGSEKNRIPFSFGIPKEDNHIFEAQFIKYYDKLVLIVGGILDQMEFDHLELQCNSELYYIDVSVDEYFIYAIIFDFQDVEVKDITLYTSDKDGKLSIINDTLYKVYFIKVN